MSPDQPVLDVENLSISFFSHRREIPAVVGFSCRVSAGETLGLVGESGCGKSTVALAAMRDLGAGGRIVGGSIRFRGRELTRMGERELRGIRGSGIAMVYQEPAASLNPVMRIGAQLAEVAMLHLGASRAEAAGMARAAMADVGLGDAERILASYPHQLSGGQQQRIVIAMALMARPELLILDEPTTALDVTVEAGVMDLLRDLRARHGTAMLFISHNLGLVREVCDRICVMYAGEAVETGTTGEIFARMRHPYTQALFRALPGPAAARTSRPLRPIPGRFPLPHERPPGCNFGPRCEHFVAGRCDAGEIAMVALGGGHATRCLRHGEIGWSEGTPAVGGAERLPVGEPVLRVENLKKYHQAIANAWSRDAGRIVRANEDVSFEVRAGETLAIVGESGCGKSTLARVLVGLETATSGRVLLDGTEIGGLPVERRAPGTVADLQMVFQNPFDTLNPSMSIGRQIVRTLEVFGVGVSGRERRERMLELLDLVRLPRVFAERMPRQLSGGEKQRVGIARALAGGARIVVADEAVSALDVSVQAAIVELLADLQRTRGLTLVFISHDLSIVRYLADRVVVMYLGHVVEAGTVAQVFAPPYHPYTEALLSAAPVAAAAVTRQRIVLEGEIPSSVDPPPGCPFQTRCRWKRRVPGNLCETELPPWRDLGDGHGALCWLSEAELARMEPVIRLAAE